MQIASYQPPTLAETLADALKNDFFFAILITSQSQGKKKSMNLPFGLGKTTLAMWISYVLHGQNWDGVFNDMFYYPSKLAKAIKADPNKPEDQKLPNAIWDDVQMMAPAENVVPRPIRNLAGLLSTKRPECSVLTMTAPNILSIAAPLRKLVVFELIVWERSHYEVQRISFRKNFKNPYQDLMDLSFIEGDDLTTRFDPLPPEIQTRYNKWRVEMKVPFEDTVITDLEKYEKRTVQKQYDEALATADKEASDHARWMSKRRWGKTSSESG